MISENDKRLLDNGIGNVTWWGYSPPRDLLGDSPTTLDPDGGIPAEGDDQFNVLVAGAGDLRHVLQILGSANEEQSESRKSRKVSIFLWEQNLMMYARQLLFLSIVLEEGPGMGKRAPTDRCRMLLEIFGNVRLKPDAAKYLRLKVSHLIDICGREASRDVEEPNELSRGSWLSVDMSRLKYKELDKLERIFRLWRNDEGIEVDMNGIWRDRVEKLLGIRADVKEGVFDMDYQFRLVERGGGNVSLLEYRKWRTDGMAFLFSGQGDDKDVGDEVEDPDSAATITNFSLISSVVESGVTEPSSRRGYFGDIVTGPYIPFGPPETKHESMPLDDPRRLQRCSQNLVMSRLSSIMEQITKNVVEAAKSRMQDGAAGDNGLPQITLTFLPVSSDRNMMRNGYLMGISLDVAFVACGVSHLIRPKFHQMLRPAAATIVAETPLFVLHMSEEIQKRFKDHLLKVAKAMDLDMEDYDEMRQSCALLRRNNKSQDVITCPTANLSSGDDILVMEPEGIPANSNEVNSVGMDGAGGENAIDSCIDTGDNKGDEGPIGNVSEDAHDDVTESGPNFADDSSSVLGNDTCPDKDNDDTSAEVQENSD